jgi:ubiquinone/menaquinone biosynthesis C-methylase UbiE
LKLPENPAPKSAYVHSARDCIQWGLPFSFVFQRQVLLRLFSFLFSHYSYSYKALRGNQSLLDVGTGMGMTMNLQRKLGFNGQLIGVDIMRYYLRELKKNKIYDDLVLADAFYLPFKNNSVDALFSFEMVEHIPKSLGLNVIKDFERIS